MTLGGGAFLFQSLDAWRGVAALAVLNFHLIGFLSAQSQTIWDSPVIRALSHGYIGVEMFFVISGYCIAAACVASLAKGRTVGEFAWARARRILPPYWAALGVMAACVVVWRVWGRPDAPVPIDYGAMMTPQSVGVYLGSLLLAHVPLGQPILLGVSWTLAYELAFYLLCAGSLALFGRRGSGRAADATMWGLHALTVGSLLWLIFLPERRAFPFDMWPHFGLGVLVFDLLRRPRVIGPRLTAGLAVALFAAFGVLHPHLPHRIVDHHTPPISAAVGVGFAALLLATYRFDAKIARWWPVTVLGKIGLFSYSLYLTHYTLLSLWTAFVVGWPGAASLVKVQFWALTLACVLAGYLFFLVAERPLLARKAKGEKVSGAEGRGGSAVVLSPGGSVAGTVSAVAPAEGSGARAAVVAHEV